MELEIYKFYFQIQVRSVHEVTAMRLNYVASMASLAKSLNVCLWTKWLWVWIRVLSPKFQVLHLFQVRSFLTFTLKHIHDIIITYRHNVDVWLKYVSIIDLLMSLVSEWITKIHLKYTFNVYLKSIPLLKYKFFQFLQKHVWSIHSKYT